MPTYSYKCSACDTTFDKVVPRSEYAQPQACECGQDAKRVVGDVGFVLKGDGWVGKNQKLKGQMAQKNQRLDVKSRERRHDAPGMRLAPNVNGERVDSWDEAAKLAKSKGLNADSYATKARQEAANT
jgi:putative FmdB family regulatory protein